MQKISMLMKKKLLNNIIILDLKAELNHCFRKMILSEVQNNNIFTQFITIFYQFQCFSLRLRKLLDI